MLCLKVPGLGAQAQAHVDLGILLDILELSYVGNSPTCGLLMKVDGWSSAAFVLEGSEVDHEVDIAAKTDLCPFPGLDAAMGLW